MARCPVIADGVGVKRRHFHVRKRVVDDETTGFFAVPLAPCTASQPQSEFSGKADEADQLAVIDCPNGQIVFPKAQYPRSSVVHREGR